MTLGNNFQVAVARINRMTEKQPDDVLLKLYGYYKVATVGKNTASRPGILNVKGRKKWEAWKEVESLTTEQAKAYYVQTVLDIVEK